MIEAARERSAENSLLTNRKVPAQDRAINQFQPNRLHPLSILSVKSPIVSLNLGGLVVAVSQSVLILLPQVS